MVIVPKNGKYGEKIQATKPEKVAFALARKYHWTISACGDVALNKLGLSTQVPVVWTYISDGPYRDFGWDNIRISFKHKTNREISLMSDISALIVEAIKTMGKEHIDEKTITILKKRLNPEEKAIVLSETKGVSSWIYEIIRKVCE